MYDYMKALHARFCREPELQKAREELDPLKTKNAYRALPLAEDTIAVLKEQKKKAGGSP